MKLSKFDYGRRFVVAWVSRDQVLDLLERNLASYNPAIKSSRVWLFEC